MLSIIRKFGKVFRGGVHPLEVGISVGLAVLAGVVLGKNGSAGILLLLILILNTNKIAFSLAGIPFGALGLTLARYKFLVGRWALAQDSIRSVFERLANTPVGAFLGFDRYSVVGGFIAGVPLAIVCGLLAMILTRKFRVAALALVGDPEAFNGWMGGKLARAGKWILFGVGDADYEASLTKKPRPIRWSGVVLLLVLSLLVLIASMIDYGPFARPMVEEYLTNAVGAQVDIGSLSFKPLKAAVRVTDLAVTDRAEPSKNAFAAKSLLADLSVVGLLRRSVIVEDVVVSRVEMGAKRDAPGRVVAPVETDTGAEEGLPVPKDMETIDQYLTQWKTWKEHLDSLKETLDKLEDGRRKSSAAKTPGEPGAGPDYDAIAAEHGYDSIKAPEIGRVVPDLVVDSFTVEDIRTANEYFNVIDLDVENVVYPLRMSTEPTMFRITDKQGKGSIDLNIHFGNPNDPPQFKMAMKGVPAVDLNNHLGSKVPVTFTKGSVEFKSHGTIPVDDIHVKVYVNLSDTEMKAKKNVSIAGLRGKDLDEALNLIKQSEIWLSLTGPLNRPRVKVESGALEESLKKTLTEAMKKKITAETEKVKEELEKEKARLEKEKKILEQKAEYEKKQLQDAAEAEKREAERKLREEKKRLEKKMKKAIEEEADKKAKELIKDVFN